MTQNISIIYFLSLPPWAKVSELSRFFVMVTLFLDIISKEWFPQTTYALKIAPVNVCCVIFFDDLVSLKYGLAMCVPICTSRCNIYLHSIIVSGDRVLSHSSFVSQRIFTNNLLLNVIGINILRKKFVIIFAVV